MPAPGSPERWPLWAGEGRPCPPPEPRRPDPPEFRPLITRRTRRPRCSRIILKRLGKRRVVECVDSVSAGSRLRHRVGEDRGGAVGRTLQGRRGQVRVPLRHGRIGMPQDLLDLIQGVPAGHEI